MISLTKIGIFILLFSITIAGSNAAYVSLVQSPPSAAAGQSFDISIIVDPEGAAIAGGQLNIGFDKSRMKINRVTEGDFLSRSGANTFFSNGSIDNQIGTVINIYSAILGPKNVATRGTFLVINATAIVTITEASGVSLSNVLFSTPEGVAVTLGTAQANTPTNPGSGSSGSSGSGAGGGAGGASGEDYANIELIEKYDRDISKDFTTSYQFKKKNNPVIYLNITGNTNSIDITAVVEVLKATSSLVKSPPSGIIYKNLNIWLGTFGYATARNIKHAEIIFKVPVSWMESNNIDPDSIELLHYDGTWRSLPTVKMSENKGAFVYGAVTESFSHFAIRGKKADIPYNFQDYMVQEEIQSMGYEQQDEVMNTGDSNPYEPVQSSNTKYYLMIGAFAGIVTNSILVYQIKKVKKH